MSLIHKIEAHPPKMFRGLYPRGLWTIDNSENKIYLTFDDGPIPEVTEWVLDLLKSYGIHATFFCVGENVMRYPHIYRRLIDEGNSVGCHTYNHLNAWHVSSEFYNNNIDLCRQYVESRLFRPPHGKLRPRITSHLKECNYQLVLWDVVTRDYDHKVAPAQCFDYVKRYAHSGSIVVFHDSLKAEHNLREALPMAIEYLLQQGYVFDTIKAD